MFKNIRDGSILLFSVVYIERLIPLVSAGSMKAHSLVLAISEEVVGRAQRNVWDFALPRCGVELQTKKESLRGRGQLTS